MLPAAYDELRQIASRYLARERVGHTLQTTALVHEAYLRLLGRGDLGDGDRTHFLGTAARAMRLILVDHARRRNAAKRGGHAARVPLDDTLAMYEARCQDLIALDEALARLSQMDPQLGRVVELRFFGGLTEEEAASVLQVSPRTVRRSWRIAKMWLWSELKGEERGEA